MKRAKQLKVQSVKQTGNEKEFLRARRSVAFELYSAVHDMVEAYEWARKDATRHFGDFCQATEFLSKFWKHAEDDCHKYEKLVESSRKRLARVEALWAEFQKKAKEAGVPEDEDQTHGLARITRTKDIQTMDELMLKFRRARLGLA